MSKRIQHYSLVKFIDLTDDVDELLELHSQALSLRDRATNELNLRKSEIALIKNKLKVARANLVGDLMVSDHAVVRYLERVTGLDIDACKKELLSKLSDDYVRTEGFEFTKIEGDNMQFVIRDNLIVSVTPTKVSDLVATDKDVK